MSILLCGYLTSYVQRMSQCKMSYLTLPGIERPPHQSTHTAALHLLNQTSEPSQALTGIEARG